MPTCVWRSNARGQRANIAARAMARSNASTLLLDAVLGVELAAAAGQAGAQLAVADDAGQRGGELLGGGRRAARCAPRRRCRRRRRPWGCTPPAARRRPPRARPRRRARTATAGRRRRRPRRRRAGRRGRCSRRSAPARSRRAASARSSPSSGPLPTMCSSASCGVRPARANASISPPTFLSGTSRATVSRRTGPSWLRLARRRTGGADRLGVERLQADLDGVGRGAERQEPLPRGAAGRDEPRARGRPASGGAGSWAAGSRSSIHGVFSLKMHERDAAAARTRPRRAARSARTPRRRPPSGPKPAQLSLQPARPDDRRPPVALAAGRRRGEPRRTRAGREPAVRLIPSGRPPAW